MRESIPSTMRALVLERHHDDVVQAIDGLRVAQRPTPTPRRGQVLVSIEAAPGGRLLVKYPEWVD